MPLNELLGHNPIRSALGNGHFRRRATGVTCGRCDGWADQAFWTPLDVKSLKGLPSLPRGAVGGSMLKNPYRLSCAASARKRMSCIVYDPHKVFLVTKGPAQLRRTRRRSSGSNAGGIRTQPRSVRRVLGLLVMCFFICFRKSERHCGTFPSL